MRIKNSTVVSIIALAFFCLGASPVLAGDHETKVRWDIVQISFSASGVPTVSAGGVSTSVAACIPLQGGADNSTITLKGSGTFEPGEPHHVTGGGTWATAPGAVSDCPPPTPPAPTHPGTELPASGTYTVTGFLFWKMSRSDFAATGIIDGIGNPADVQTGLAVLRVHYSDGEDGILTISCTFGPPTPPSVFEGTTATKGFVDYSNPISNTGLDGNTFFHVMQEDEDD